MKQLESTCLFLASCCQSLVETHSETYSTTKQEHIDGMKPGSVVVDLAAETGGNVATTKRGFGSSFKIMFLKGV